MTEEELQKLRNDVAIKVMGWRREDRPEGYMWSPGHFCTLTAWWADGDGEIVIARKDWHPDRDYNQTFQVVAEMRRRG